MCFSYNRGMKITILEDETKVSDTIQEYLFSFFQEKQMGVPSITVFNNGYDLLETYSMDTDVLFMDIQVPGMSGMETAKRIREKDGNVIIVFVTNLSQYAIKGYEVNAFDFILKPIDYNGFSMKLNRILTEYSHLHENYYVNIKNKEGVVRIPLEDLLYIEVVSHNIVFHKSDEEITIRGVLKDYVDDLSKHYFCLCNKGYLVNLANVRKVDKIFAFMSDGTKLLISKGKRKEFLEELNKYLGGTI